MQFPFVLLLISSFKNVQSQDFLSFISPFVGSALGGSSISNKPFNTIIRNGFGARPPKSANLFVQPLLSQFIDSGDSSGSNKISFPFQEYVELGIDALSNSGAETRAFFNPQTSLTSPTATGRIFSQLIPNSKQHVKRDFRNGNFDLVPLFRTDFSRFIPFQNNVIQSQPIMNTPTPRTGTTGPKPNEVITLSQTSSAKAFGQSVFRMLDEISQYSDVHHQQYQDYKSVQKLMHSFFHAMAGKSDNSPSVQLSPLNDGTEIGRNRPVANELFESDIVLTVDQLKRIVLAERDHRLGKEGKRRTKRKVITGGVYRWPKNTPIPYEFKNADATWQALIRSALAFWESETCVRWQENGYGFDRIVFFRGSGCYSSIGRTGGQQMISIGQGCENVLRLSASNLFQHDNKTYFSGHGTLEGVITHEVGHSLGFWHEQSRPDRDSYIRIIHKYIAEGTEGNFVKRSSLETDDMGLPFDLGSVMHYGPMAFTKDWSHITIETKDPRYSRTIGQRTGPSFIDVKQVNRLYCYDSCANSHLKCQNGGYPDPNNCRICKCPPGLGGQLCDAVQPSDCGGELTASDIWKNLTFRGKNKCYWKIKAPGNRIRMIIDSISLQCLITCQSFVEIKHNSDFQQTGFRICCSEKKEEVLSEQDEMIVIYNSMELNSEGSFGLRYVIDNSKPLPKLPPSVWVTGRENRIYRELDRNGGPIEKFILNSIPQIRDPRRPVESIASIVTDFTIGQLLGVNRD